MTETTGRTGPTGTTGTEPTGTTETGTTETGLTDPAGTTGTSGTSGSETAGPTGLTGTTEAEPTRTAGTTDTSGTTGASRTGGRTVDIADRVRAIAASDPGRVALVHATKRWGSSRIRYRRHTYRELSDRAEALAVGLRGIGVAEGTLCSFMVPPGIDAMVLGLALWRIGAVVVGIEPHSHGLRNVAKSLAKVGPTVFVGTPRAHAGRRAFGWGRGTVRTNVIAGRLGLPGRPTLRSLERHPVPAEPAPGAITPADPAVIAFTTGSTGAPKPTVLRQRNLAAMMDLVLGHWGYRDGRDVVDMTTFPMFWIIGLSAGAPWSCRPWTSRSRAPATPTPPRWSARSRSAVCARCSRRRRC